MSFLLHQTETFEPKDEPVPQEKHQDLLIFGYQCKLFQDDAKALAIDNGEHLIPWMGDSNLKIDRYDGRGHLFDLRPYDADNTDQCGEPTSDEKRIERLCEEERYLELHTDIAEKALQEEEEIKRLNMELASSSGYQAVGFSYDQPNTDTAEDGNQPSNSEGDAAADGQEEEEDSEFIPPPELCLPKSMLYPSGTKLNALIEKTAKFVSSHGGQMEIMIKTKQANNPQFKFLNFEHHLNPYYKHQVYMIKSGRYNPDIHNKPAAPKQEVTSESSDDEDEGDHSGYLHPSLMAKATTSQPTESANTVPLYTQSQLENTSYGKLLKKMSDKLPSLTNSPQRTGTPTYSDHDSNSQSAFTDRALEAAAGTGQSTTSAVQGYGVDGYAYDPAYYSQYYQGYGDGTVYPTESSERPPSPPDDVKPLIERLIGYISKDGEAFEKQVMAKNDSRFSFMHPGDASHEYYKWRKQWLLLEQYNADGSRAKGVSFSIKQKEPELNSVDTSRAALPVDPESDDEQGKSEKAKTVTIKEALPRGISPSQYLPNPPVSETVKVEDRPPPPSEESLQKKLAEQKLRDKLAAAAREKMTQVTQNTKEKSLQAERKRRAAMFVNMLKTKPKPSLGLPPPMIGPELPAGNRSNSPDVSAAENRLIEDPDVEYVSSSRGTHSKSRSPPSAYSARANRERGSSRYESRDRRQRRDGKSSHHRKRRSPSPSLPPKKHKPSAVRESSLALPPAPRGLLDDQDTRYTSHRPSSRTSHSMSQHSSHSTSLGGSNSSLPPPLTNHSSNKDDDEFMLKIRKMLKESRQAVYKEDVFGS